jgi:transglutaminase-like putative cysteine protease
MMMGTMRLHIDHVTTFTYSELISEAHTTIRLKPMDAWGQRCLSFNVTTEPRAEVNQYSDFMSNDVRHFDILQPHRQLVVSATSEVQTPEVLVSDGRPLTPLEQHDFMMDTYYTPHAPELCSLATCCAVPGDPYASALAMMDAVNRALKYQKGITDVKTTAIEALACGGGVCQDYTHIMLATCRCLGLPARYVSGYLYGPNSNSDEAASHAWLDVYVNGQGWVSLDPTHNTVQTANHVRVAIGRDYADVTPTHGVYTGKATETLSVMVRVYPTTS